jgi:hypothetical protein
MGTKVYKLPILLIISLVTMAPGSCNRDIFADKTPSVECKGSLTKALNKIKQIEQHHSSLPDFSSWDQERSIIDEKEVNDWFKRFPGWTTVMNKTTEMRSELKKLNEAMKKSTDQQCASFIPNSSTAQMCNGITKADTKIKTAQRVGEGVGRRDAYGCGGEDMICVVMQMSKRSHYDSDEPGGRYANASRPIGVHRYLNEEIADLNDARIMLEKAKQDSCF